MYVSSSGGFIRHRQFKHVSFDQNSADISIHLTREERQSKILDRWGFTCTCELCTAPAAVAARLDQGRKKIMQIKHQIIDDLDGLNLHAAIEHLEELINNLLAEPGGYLVPLLREPYDALAKLYRALGNKEMAEEYLHKKLDISEKYI